MVRRQDCAVSSTARCCSDKAQRRARPPHDGGSGARVTEVVKRHDPFMDRALLCLDAGRARALADMGRSTSLCDRRRYQARRRRRVASSRMITTGEVRLATARTEGCSPSTCCRTELRPSLGRIHPNRAEAAPIARRSLFDENDINSHKGLLLYADCRQTGGDHP